MKAGEQLLDTSADVVADQTHAFHALNASIRRFIGDPRFKCRAPRFSNLSLTTEHGNDVCPKDHLFSDDLRVLVTHVDDQLGENPLTARSGKHRASFPPWEP